jgi:hypothetical protein
MKKRLLFLLVTTSFAISVFSQPAEPKISAQKEKGISVSFCTNVPVGNFSNTHIIGLGIDCSPTRSWFGILKPQKIAITYNGGAAYYFGKKEKVSDYWYDYPAYIFIHAFAGIIYQPLKNVSITLTGGPALGIYNGNTQFNIGSKLEASYYISKRISLGPGILLLKESGSDALLSASLKTTLDL